MAKQQYTETDVNEILNTPGTWFLRAFQDTGDYLEAIFTNAAAFAFTPTIETVAFESTGNVFDAVGEEVGQVTFDYGKPTNMEFMALISGGLFTRTITATGTIDPEAQTIAAGWTNVKPIELKLYDSAGVQYRAAAVPVLTSVTASIVGVLAANTDYTIVEMPLTYSGYGIILNTAGPAGVATTESVVVAYATGASVAESETLSGGGKTNFTAVEGYFQTATKDDTPVRVYMHRGFYSGNLNMTFGTANSPQAAVTNVVINMKADTTKEQGEQFFTIVKGAAAMPA